MRRDDLEFRRLGCRVVTDEWWLPVLVRKILFGDTTPVSGKPWFVTYWMGRKKYHAGPYRSFDEAKSNYADIIGRVGVSDALIAEKCNPNVRVVG